MHECDGRTDITEASDYKQGHYLWQYLLRQTWLAGWLAGCPSQPVLYQNGKTYLKTFSTIW